MGGSRQTAIDLARSAWGPLVASRSRGGDCQANGSDAVELPTLKRHLANHLNLTSETFSRTFRRLSDAGLIASEGDNRVLLLDRGRLERIAAGKFPLI